MWGYGLSMGHLSRWVSAKIVLVWIECRDIERELATTSSLVLMGSTEQIRELSSTLASIFFYNSSIVSDNDYQWLIIHHINNVPQAHSRLIPGGQSPFFCSISLLYHHEDVQEETTIKK